MKSILHGGVTKAIFSSRTYQFLGRYQQLRAFSISKEIIDQAKSFSNDNGAKAAESSRFWMRQFEIEDNNVNNSSIDNVISMLSNDLHSKFQIPKSESAIIILPKYKILLPLHNGQIQTQHVVKIEKSLKLSEEQNNTMIICGFFPRAQQSSIDSCDNDRPLNEARLNALKIALQKVTNVTGEELLSTEYEGTPPSRIYRSFIAPRRNAVLLVEPVERAAERAAAQIELALRQVRADRASYLRNTDKSALLKASANLENGSGHSSPSVKSSAQHPIVLVLDNIRSAFNVGSMFRTAETAGIQEIVTCGITAHPPHPKLRKTAFSAMDTVPSRHFEDVMTAIKQLKEEGYTILVMETTSLSKQYTEIDYPKKVAVVVGNELTGVDTRVMEQAKIIAEIPTFGLKNSLNVASVAPIIIYEILRQWKATPNVKPEAPERHE